MQLVPFPEQNLVIGVPDDLKDRVAGAPACRGVLPPHSSLAGHPFLVVAWEPSDEDIERLKAGGFIYLTFIGQCPIHCCTTTFEDASTL